MAVLTIKLYFYCIFNRINTDWLNIGILFLKHKKVRPKMISLYMYSLDGNVSNDINMP